MIDIEPTSPAGRVATALFAHRQARLPRGTIAKMLGITFGQVDAALQPGVEAGLLTMANDADIGRVYVAGRLLKDWPDAASAITTSRKATNTATAPRKAPGIKRTQLPPLDIKTIKIGTAEMPRARVGEKGKTRHDSLFDSLSADGMCATGIPAEYTGALVKAAQVYLKRRPALQAAIYLKVRRLPNGTIGVWRIKRAAGEGAQE